GQVVRVCGDRDFEGGKVAGVDGDLLLMWPLLVQRDSLRATRLGQRQPGGLLAVRKFGPVPSRRCRNAKASAGLGEPYIRDAEFLGEPEHRCGPDPLVKVLSGDFQRLPPKEGNSVQHSVAETGDAA